MNRRGLGNRNADRRSAGLGSDGGARTYTHAVGVRAHGERAICSAVVHRRNLLVGVLNYSLTYHGHL